MPTYLDIESTSRKADTGMVVAIGLLGEREPRVRFAGTLEEERGLLEWLREELRGCDSLVTWYGSGFDIPFLLSRASVQGVDLSQLARIPMLDLCEWCRGHLLLSSYRLESVARFLGVGIGAEFYGGDVATLFKLALRGDEGARELIIEHCKSDLRVLRQVHEKLKPQLEDRSQ